MSQLSSLNWSGLAGKLIGSGAPLLGKMIGGLLPVPGGSLIGEALGGIIAGKFGVEPDPEAVNAAIDAADPAVAVEKLKLAEVEAAAKWPALAEMAKAQHEAETMQFKAQLEDVADARARDLKVREQNNGTNLRANLLIVLAFAYVFVGTTFVFWKITELSSAGSVAVLTFLTTTMGGMMTYIGMVYAFEFGATRQGGDRSNQMADLAQQVVKQATTTASPASSVLTLAK